MLAEHLENSAPKGRAGFERLDQAQGERARADRAGKRVDAVSVGE
jgi:hypothetical protein